MTKPPKNQKLSSVRIIAGEYRRRLVEFVDADGLRPTPDRVRETLFNWLNDSVVNAYVLDCCAGSGALGFEAISRGARHAVMIEPNVQQFHQLLKTQSQLHIGQSKLNIINATAQKALTNITSKQAFDIVFLDPPYSLQLWQDILELLINQTLITPESILYIEADKPHEQMLENYYAQMTIIKQKKMGQIYCGLYQLADN